MKLSLASNIASLGAQRQLVKTQEELGSVYERLASGARINRASDDAAGLAIADTLAADRRIYSQAQRNINDGVSLLTIADGALAALTDVSTRIVELAEQAANGAYSDAQRLALDAEAQALRSEMRRIVDSTKYNGRALLSDQGESVSLQVGKDGTMNSLIAVELESGLASAVGTGVLESFESIILGSNPRVVATGDMNGDGNLDIVTAQFQRAGVILGNGDGTFQAAQTYNAPATGSNNDLVLGDFDNDGDLDVLMSGSASLLLNNGDGTLGAATNIFANGGQVVEGDLNGDGFLDIVLRDSSNDRLQILLNNGDATFSDGGFRDDTGRNHPELYDVNGDGHLDLLSSAPLVPSSNRISVALGNGDGTFGASSLYSINSATSVLRLGDVNNDGNVDIVARHSATNDVEVLLGNGDGSFGAGQIVHNGTMGYNTLELYDLNDDGFLDLITGDEFGTPVLLGDGTGNFTQSDLIDEVPYATSIAFGDFNGDFVPEVVIGEIVDDGVHIFSQELEQGLALVDLTTIDNARTSLTRFRSTLEDISASRGKIGASLSRLQSALEASNANEAGAESAERRIRDADIAFETAQLVQKQILQQSVSAILAQANQIPALVLQLL